MPGQGVRSVGTASTVLTCLKGCPTVLTCLLAQRQVLAPQAPRIAIAVADFLAVGGFGDHPGQHDRGRAVPATGDRMQLAAAAAARPAPVRTDQGRKPVQRLGIDQARSAGDQDGDCAAFDRPSRKVLRVHGGRWSA